MNYLQKNRFFREIIQKVKSKGAKDRVEKIRPYLDKKEKILDIGAGSCIVSEILEKEGYDITPIDVKNLSFTENIEPVIYNGKEIPFKEDEFNVSLILTVLHHTLHPEKILEEAKRVSKKIIVIEDIYTSLLSKYWTYFIDSLLNLEFIGCARKNNKDQDWKKIFDKLSLKISGVKYYRSLFGVKRVLYCLEK